MGGFVKGVLGGGGDAARGARDAARIQADYQKEALEYLKEREALPQEYREAALTRLAGGVGIGDGESQQVQIDKARQSPLFAAIMGGRDAGEESILRNRAATGGLRSGGTQEALYDYNTQLENTALLESYNQQQNQLGQLAGLGSYAPQIAQQTSNIGQTLAQGKVAATQARQTGNQQGFNNLLGLGSLAITAFSDIRLKDNIKPIGEWNGYTWYEWDWNKKANKIGLYGKGWGVMAHEVFKHNPEAIGQKEGYITVDMKALEAA